MSHKPTLPLTLHALQASVQSLLQQTPSAQCPLTQSTPLVQAFPCAQFAQYKPPQSTSVSLPFFLPSLQRKHVCDGTSQKLPGVVQSACDVHWTQEPDPLQTFPPFVVQAAPCGSNTVEILPLPSHSNVWQSSLVCIERGVPAGVNVRVQIRAAQIHGAHSVDSPQSSALMQPTHSPAPSQTPSGQGLRASAGRCWQTFASHVQTVHSGGSPQSVVVRHARQPASSQTFS